jgi:hypothetical protein
MKAKHILLVLIFLIFVVRLSGLNIAIYDDEANFAFSVSNMNELGFNESYYSPVFFNVLYIPFIALFGVSIALFRFVPYVFGVINLALLYLFAKRNYGRKVAYGSVFLMAASFYASLASLQFDVEGSMIMFTVLATFFSYKEYERSKKSFWLILCGLFLGATFVNKYNTVYIAVVLGIYSLVQSKYDFRKTFKDLFPLGLSALSVVLFYLWIAVVSSPNWWNFVSIVGVQRYVGVPFNPIALFMFLLWSTPLLFGFYILSIVSWKKENRLYVLWITIPILFYTFISPFGAFDRYLMNTIPAMSILGGIYLSKIRFNRKHIIFASMISVISYLFMLVLNSIPLRYVSRSPSSYFQHLLSFNFNFLFSYTSSSGPTFGVSFLIILITFCLSAVLLFFIVISKRTLKFATFCLVLFLAINIAFNAILIQEQIFHVQGSNPSQATYDMLAYVKEHNLSYPIYSNDSGILFYIDKDYRTSNETIGLPDNELDAEATQTINQVNSVGGTILLLNWPPIPKESPIHSITKLCLLEKEWNSNGNMIGQIYIC